MYLFVNYGWYILLAFIFLAILWTYVKPALMRWLKKREEANFDPDKAERYQDAMMRAREKMQEELNEKAKQHQDWMKKVGTAWNNSCNVLSSALILILSRRRQRRGTKK